MERLRDWIEITIGSQRGDTFYFEAENGTGGHARICIDVPQSHLREGEVALDVLVRTVYKETCKGKLGLTREELDSNPIWDAKNCSFTKTKISEGSRILSR